MLFLWNWSGITLRLVKRWYRTYSKFLLFSETRTYFCWLTANYHTKETLNVKLSCLYSALWKVQDFRDFQVTTLLFIRLLCFHKINYPELFLKFGFSSCKSFTQMVSQSEYSMPLIIHATFITNSELKIFTTLQEGSSVLSR